MTDASAADVAAGTRYAYDFDDDGSYESAGTRTPRPPRWRPRRAPGLTADGDDTSPCARLIDKDDGSRPDVDDQRRADTRTLTGDAVDEGEAATVAFSAQADPSAADTATGFTYEYDLDDDGTFEPGGASVTLPDEPTEDGPAMLDVHAAIIDRDGGRTEYDTTVTVANVAPTATVTGPTAVPSSGGVSLEVESTIPHATER